MAWSASVTDVTKSNGNIEVTLEFTNGVDTFTEVYRSTNPQSNWIENTVFFRLGMLDVVDGYAIDVGPVTPVDPSPDVDEVLFQRAVGALNLAETMVNMGVITEGNAKLATLKTYIQNNAAAYFDSLYSTGS